jgi:hypothetical protein
MVNGSMVVREMAEGGMVVVLEVGSSVDGLTGDRLVLH